MKAFIDRYGRAQRIVWSGLTRVRLQDNRGNTLVITYDQLADLL